MSKNFGMENKNLREPLRGRVPRGCEKKDSEGNKICRVCNGVIIQTGRRTFCSPACVHEHMLRSNIDYMRRFVFERDKGICTICKIDCVSLLEKSKEMSLNDYTRLLLPLGFIRGRIIQAYEKKVALWDADHILPVEHGGGGCGLDGMRTLCVACHQKVTRTQIFIRNNCSNLNQETLWGSKISDE